MGASRRRIDRRLSRPPAPLPVVAGVPHPLFVPAISIVYAGTVAAGLLAVDQLAQYMPGPWLDLLDVAVVLFAVLTVTLFLQQAWRRHREGLDQRSVLWLSGGIGAAMLAALAIYALVQSAEIYSVLSGADVQVTRPMIESLPRPPGTTIQDEKPGLVDTETISEDIHADDLRTIVPFYERELPPQGWTEDKTSATTSIVRFTRSGYLLSVELDPHSGGYTLVIDRQTDLATDSPSA